MPTSPWSRRRALLVLGLTVLLAVPVLASAADARTGRPSVTSTCTDGTYTVAKGDSWSLIASRLKVTMAALLAANGATTSMVIHPGDLLCAPAGAVGASTTLPPTTTSPSTTAAPTGSVRIAQFPVQGVCWFTDTWQAPRSGGRRHEGVDILAKTGQLLYAVDDGTLTKQYFAGSAALTGNGWRLTRADGTYFFYAHLSAFAPGLKVGSTVKAGQIIGAVGMTGNAGAPHLHFEVHPAGGAAVNPTAVVKAVDGCSTSVVPAQPAPAGGSTTTSTTLPATTTTVKAPAGSTTTTTAPKSTTTTTTVKPAVTTTTVKAPATSVPNSAPPTTTVASSPVTVSSTSWSFIAPVLAYDTKGNRLTTTPRPVTVAGLTGVPANTEAVMVRLIARNVTAKSHVVLQACGTNTTVSTLNLEPDRLNAIVTLSRVTNGAVCLSATSAVDVRMAVIAVQAPGVVGVGMNPMARRAVDTTLPATGGNIAATPTMLGQPSGAKAVSVTITLLDPSGAGSLGLGACGGTPWIVATTSASRQVISAVVRTNAAGVCISSSVGGRIIVDVTGMWTGAAPMATATPSRLFDSRTAGAVTTTPQQVTLPLPKGATKAVVSVVAVGGASAADVWVWNCAAKKPTGSLVSTSAGAITNAVVGLDAGGQVCVASSSSARVIIDLLAVG